LDLQQRAADRASVREGSGKVFFTYRAGAYRHVRP